MTEDIEVVRNDDARRYEIRVGGTVGGFMDFRTTSPDRLTLPHTEVDPAFKGRGLGTTLVGDALADIARRGETVVPVCPFVTRYLKENDVAGLVVDWPDADDAQESATPGEQPA